MNGDRLNKVAIKLGFFQDGGALSGVGHLVDEDVVFSARQLLFHFDDQAVEDDWRSLQFNQ